MKNINQAAVAYFLKNNRGNPGNDPRQNVFTNVRLRKSLLISFSIFKPKTQISYEKNVFPI